MIVCFAGYGGVGKDEATAYLVETYGYARRAPGDYAKRAVLGPDESKWPTHGHRKDAVRPALEEYVSKHIDRIVGDITWFYDASAKLCGYKGLAIPRVNTAREMALWRQYGAKLIWLWRDGYRPCTQYECIMHRELQPFIDVEIQNNGNKEDLHAALDSVLIPWMGDDE